MLREGIHSQVIDIQEKKKKLVEQAFSGIKSRETQRQKKEARLKGELDKSSVFSSN